MSGQQNSGNAACLDSVAYDRKGERAVKLLEQSFLRLFTDLPEHWVITSNSEEFR